MCSLLEIRAFGSEAVLRYKIMDRLRKLKKDDKQIDKEGVESLNLAELIDACRQRGIHTGKGVEYMRKKLKDWIQLSIYSDVPIPLLILSRAFALSRADATTTATASPSAETDDLAAGLAETIAHLPETVVEDTSHHVVTRSAGSIDDAEVKLRMLQQEQQKVDEERKLQAALQQQQAGVGVTDKPIMAPVDLEAEQKELREIKEDNDEVEEDIDQAHAAEIAPHAVSMAQTGTTTPPAEERPSVVTPAQASTVEQPTTASDSTAPLSVSPPTVTTTTTPTTATTTVSDKQLHKEEQKVDRFNDKLEQYLEHIEKDLQKLSLQDRKQREEEERVAKLDAQQKATPEKQVKQQQATP
jgi:hypothetical protein